ncbi:MAG: 1-acyl-sn-glycerol-3-phosphate acyltransferase, partial [Mollicutes bacterium]|nr:1-acyl-sn-glycerol-3-phosphate acyltransferase [Mollicutes bacterium]
MSNLLYFLTTFSAVIPELIYFKRRTYFENKKNQGRHIKGRAIIVSNHISIIDYMMLMFVFFTRKIRCLVASVVYKKNKILNLLLKMCGAIKVERENYNLSFIQKSIDVLNKNKVLLIFPEGKLDNDKTKIRQFTTSYLLLALKTKSPIIPVYNDGNYGFKRRVHCMVGEKIYLEKYIDTDNP